MSATKDGNSMKLSGQIAKSIRIDADYVEDIAKRNYLYAKYYIDKKGGGKREILQPSKELKVVQHWLLRHILSKFPVSEYSYAYSKGDSVKKNALVHQESRYMLHADIKNFFPSITRKMLTDYFAANQKIVNDLKLQKEDIDFILDICLYRGEYLVIGSVASPRISNMIMYKFDMELKEELDKITQLIYTRYADDIVISSKNYIDGEVVNIVAHLMEKNGFTINHKKTHFMNKKHRRQVTGVVIDNNLNKLSIGNAKYKMIKRCLYQYLVKGEGNPEYIKGYLAYIKELNVEQYNQIEQIYKKYDKSGQIFK